jgi:hypothetical protein
MAMNDAFGIGPPASHHPMCLFVVEPKSAQHAARAIGLWTGKPHIRDLGEVRVGGQGLCVQVRAAKGGQLVIELKAAELAIERTFDVLQGVHGRPATHGEAKGEWEQRCRRKKP